MFPKIITSHFVLFLMASLLLSCNQLENKATDENKSIRIPVSVNDSVYLSIDKSPMDMSYYPADYPKEKMISPNLDKLVARIIYSRPQKNGRILFADTSVTQNFIQHYEKEWRLGANEATEIEFFKIVSILDIKLCQAGILYIVFHTLINGKLFLMKTFLAGGYIWINQKIFWKLNCL